MLTSKHPLFQNIFVALEMKESRKEFSYCSPNLHVPSDHSRNMMDISILWSLSTPLGDRIPDPSFLPSCQGGSDAAFLARPQPDHAHFIGRETETPEA